jgi:predicted phosphoadenosine phosphosulfate sulfurtransferase
MKKYLNINVLEAAKERTNYIFNNFEKIYLSFSGGKDSTVMLHIAMEECKKRNIKIGVLFVDLECQYKYTINHVSKMYDKYKEYIIPFWCCLPISLSNAVSQYEPKWMCWQPGKEWIRDYPKNVITDINYFDWFSVGMEFEEFVPLFGKWYGEGKNTACLIGIRSDESLHRYTTITRKKTTFLNKQWTTHIIDLVYNCYPIYDMRTKDIWIYNAKYKKEYNKLYDVMHKAGLSIHQQRICQPFGNDQRKGLWLYHIIEPETWGKLISRVNGANFGATYVCETGNVMGNIKIKRPPGHTWKSFAKLLLNSMPEKTKEHYENKIVIFLKWWADKDIKYNDDIPDEGNHKEEAEKKIPSWRRICKTLLRNDWWCKGLSFSITNNNVYMKYLKLMRRKKKEWEYKKHVNCLNG